MKGQTLMDFSMSGAAMYMKYLDTGNPEIFQSSIFIEDWLPFISFWPAKPLLLLSLSDSFLKSRLLLKIEISNRNIRIR